jgi:hypothetical protein
MNQITEHVPSFVVKGSPPLVHQFETVAELLNTTLARRYKRLMTTFVQFSVDDGGGKPLLIAEYVVEEKPKWWVVGYLEHDVPDLPRWVAPK